MPQIGSRVFVAGGAKQYCSLLNDELIRYIGTDWSSLRIGLLCALGTDGVNNITGRLAIGVCSGNTNPVGSSNTTLFVGTRTLSPGTWTYNANAGNPYFSTGSQYALRRVGASDTTAGVSVTNLFIATNTGSLQRRSMVFVDVAKAGTETPQYTASAQIANDNTFTNWLEGLEYANSGITVQNVALTSSSQQSISFDQTPGQLDYVDVQWTGAAQALEIYAWGVWRRS
jgi:hypothetical protein